MEPRSAAPRLKGGSSVPRSDDAIGSNPPGYEFVRVRADALLVAAGSFAMTGAALVAARSVRRRRPTGPSRGASLALETFWLSGGLAVGGFGLVAALLGAGIERADVAFAIDAPVALGASVALGSLAYYAGYLAWGARGHLAFVGFAAGALFVLMLDALARAGDATVATQLPLHALLFGAGSFGTIVGLTLLALSFGLAVLQVRAGRRAHDGVARRRGMLFGGGLGLLALAPLAGWGSLDPDIVLGVALLVAALAVFVGHQRA